MLKDFNSLSIVCLFALTATLQATSSSASPVQQQQQQVVAATNTLNVVPTITTATLPNATTFIDEIDAISSVGGGMHHRIDDGGAAARVPQLQLATTTTTSTTSSPQRNGYAQISTLDKEVVERLIKQWAPVVWLAPEEQFLPLGVDEFLNHVHPMDKDNKHFIPGVPFNEYSTKSFLVTNAEIDDLLENETSFLYGRNPNEAPVPIYGVVTLCPQRKPMEEFRRRAAIPPPPVPIAAATAPTSPELLPMEMPLKQMSSSSTRGPYIPVSIDPLEQHNDTIRRSSRLYPLFQRVKRDVLQNGSTAAVEKIVDTQKTTANNLQMGYVPFAAAMLPPQNVEESNNINVGSTFIANLADNVKFSADIEDAAGDLQTNSITDQSSAFIDAQQKRGKLPSFHVTFWMFYPYSQGKTMCTLSLGPLGRIPFPAVYGYCLGKRKDIGSHIGDWEHMSLYFNGDAEPEAMYVSAHDAGAYYSYNRLTGAFEFKRQETRKGILQRPNFPKTVTTFNDHPVLFAAKGSHGLWTAPGKHRFVKVARLYDINGFGTPWNTWKAVDISYENLKSYGRSLVPDWLTYKGKWGNPKSRCHPFKRIGLNFCEFTDGPTGIPLKEPHFECGATYR